MTRHNTLLLAVLALCLGGHAQVITGVVTDAVSGTGIESVEVFLKGTDLSVLTNADGEYAIGPSGVRVSPGTGWHGAAGVAAAGGVQVFGIDGRRAAEVVGVLPDRRTGALAWGVYVVSDGMRSERAVRTGLGVHAPPGSDAAGPAGPVGKVLADDETLVFVKSGYITRQGGAPFGSTLDMALEAEPDEKPGTHNTGPSGTLEAYDGPGTITTDGATYEDFTLAGTITIDADSVTLRNFVIDGGHYGIRVLDGHSGIVIEDGEIHGMASAGILGVGYTARRLYIHDSDGDGLKVQGSGGPTLVEYCFVEKLGMGDGAHADGNQTRGGSNITFRYNNIYMPNPGTPTYPGTPYKSNATFMLQLTISSFVIENNWLTGGNYCIYSPGGVSVRNNRFGRHNAGWIDDKDDLRIRNGTFDEWSGNVWEEDGTPIP